MRFSIVKKKPPKWIYKRAQELWGVDFYKGVVFAVNDKIYTNSDLSDDLLRHEYTHLHRQQEIGYKKWWKQYFEDQNFRLKEELIAYQNQYKWVLDNVTNIDAIHYYLVRMAEDLSGSMYGEIVDMPTAMKLIRQIE